jgi:hypothetical protein
MNPSVLSPKYKVFCCDQNGPPARREEGALSTCSLETFKLLEKRRDGQGRAVLGGSVVLSIAAAIFGAILVTQPQSLRMKIVKRAFKADV